MWDHKPQLGQIPSSALYVAVRSVMCYHTVNLGK